VPFAHPLEHLVLCQFSAAHTDTAAHVAQRRKYSVTAFDVQAEAARAFYI